MCACSVSVGGGGGGGRDRFLETFILFFTSAPRRIHKIQGSLESVQHIFKQDVFITRFSLLIQKPFEG